MGLATHSQATTGAHLEGSRRDELEVWVLPVKSRNLPDTSRRTWKRDMATNDWLQVFLAPKFRVANRIDLGCL